MTKELTMSRRVTVTNPQGLHARPAHAFVTLANRFDAQVRLSKDGEAVDGKSILSILTLAAAQGVELCIETRGPDAESALTALAQLLESRDRNGEEPAEETRAAE